MRSRMQEEEILKEKPSRIFAPYPFGNHANGNLEPARGFAAGRRQQGIIQAKSSLEKGAQPKVYLPE